MVKFCPLDTDQYLERAAAGDADAGQQLLIRHRQRLKRMIEVRMDRRLAARVDPSDIVQDALVDASRKLPQYLRERPLPFYPWLRQLAIERVIREHRRHLTAKGRSLLREQQFAAVLPDHSALELANRLAHHSSSPSDRLLRKELQARVQRALAKLPPEEREVLVLRFLEQLSTREAADVLGLTVNGLKASQRRAIEKFSQLLTGEEP